MVAIVPAAAQQTEKQKAIADLLRLTGATNIMQQMAGAVVKQMAATAKKRNPRIPDRALEILGEEVLRTFREHSAELVAARHLRPQYTLGEVRHHRLLPDADGTEDDPHPSHHRTGEHGRGAGVGAERRSGRRQARQGAAAGGRL